MSNDHFGTREEMIERYKTLDECYTKNAAELVRADALIGELRTSLSEVTRDAERYRWMRGEGNDWWVANIVNYRFEEHECGEALDSAVDSAIKRSEKKK